MTPAEFRASKEYANSMAKIKAYTKGFEFKIPFWKMTNGQKNAMNILLRDAKKQGLIESIAFGLSLEGETTEETYKRL